VIRNRSAEEIFSVHVDESRDDFLFFCFLSLSLSLSLYLPLFWGVRKGDDEKVHRAHPLCMSAQVMFHDVSQQVAE
jgi:hypothetical protein